MNWSNIISVALGIVAISVAVLSWWVTYIQARKLASRSETFVHVEGIHRLADQLDNLAEQHWLSGIEVQPSHAYELKVLAKLKLLGFKLSALKDRGITIDTQHTVLIRKSMTGAIEGISPAEVLSATLNATNSLRAAADQAYWRSYPHS